MIVLVTAAKGGVGATVVAATIGLTDELPANLVDLTGDLEAAITSEGHATVGIAAWLASEAGVDRLDDLRRSTASGARLLSWGIPPEPPAPVADDRWQSLVHWCRQRSRSGDLVVVDGGPHARSFLRAARTRSIGGGGTGPDVRQVLVTRRCYLALRRSRSDVHRPDGVVVVVEPGRALVDRDVERALGVPVLASQAWDPAVARAVDAGLDTVGLPRSAQRTGRHLRRRLGVAVPASSAA